MINKLMQFTDRYFTNIGTKLKNWAKWIFIVEAVASLIAAPIGALCFWVMAIDSYYYGFEYFLYGCLILLSLPVALAVAHESNSKGMTVTPFLLIYPHFPSFLTAANPSEKSIAFS
jgi:hypothetical protein